MYITDDGLSPFSLYEYSVSVVNSAGWTHSNYTRVKTLQANPEGLSAPNATLDPKQLFMIFLTWKPPVQPNGKTLQFIHTMLFLLIIGTPDDAIYFTAKSF